MPRVILGRGFPLQRKKQLKIDIDIGPKNSVLCQCQCMELLTFFYVKHCPKEIHFFRESPKNRCGVKGVSAENNSLAIWYHICFLRN